MCSPEGFAVLLADDPEEMIEGQPELLCRAAEVSEKEAEAYTIGHSFALEGQSSEELPVNLVDRVNLGRFHQVTVRRGAESNGRPQDVRRPMPTAPRKHNRGITRHRRGGASVPSGHLYAIELAWRFTGMEEGV